MKKKTLTVILGAVYAMGIYWFGFMNGMYCAESQREEYVIEQHENDVDEHYVYKAIDGPVCVTVPPMEPTIVELPKNN